MREHGCAADPRTVRKNIALLKDAGFDIIVNEKNGFPYELFYDDHSWDMTEVMNLVDAVSSAQFLTPAKTKKLIKKLTVLAGKQHMNGLTPDIYVSESIKSQNEIMYYIIQKIALCIRRKKKIAFTMHNYNLDKNKIHRHHGERYVMLPSCDSFLFHCLS